MASGSPNREQQLAQRLWLGRVLDRLGHVLIPSAATLPRHRPGRSRLVGSIAALGCVVLLAGCGSAESNTDGETTATQPSGPSLTARAENILRAAGYWRAYGIGEVEDVGGGLLVSTGLSADDSLEATDICNILRMKDVVLIRVYGPDGEVESDRCGDVSDS